MMKLCIAPKCKNKIRARGLCGSHYAWAQYMVASGKVTWEQLVGQGKALGTSERRGEFTKWLLGK